MTKKTKNAAKLELLVKQYGERQQELKELKKQIDGWNDEIKSIMESEGINECSVDGWTASYKVRHSESMDEKMLIEIIKQAGIKGVIKKKEYVDEEALKKLIFHQKLSDDFIMEMEKAKIIKDTVALYVKKEKE